VADGPIITTFAGTGVAADFGSGLLAGIAAGRNRGIGARGWDG
jgi:hypothetical protein